LLAATRAIMTLTTAGFQREVMTGGSFLDDLRDVQYAEKWCNSQVPCRRLGWESTRWETRLSVRPRGRGWGWNAKETLRWTVMKTGGEQKVGDGGGEDAEQDGDGDEVGWDVVLHELRPIRRATWGKLSHYQPSESSGSPESPLFPSFSSEVC
jgi:hypothetical protein